MLIFKLAWRAVWKNWRRSLITILAVFFAAYLSVVMRGMQVGYYEMSIQTVVEMFTGYFQLQDDEYKENPTINRNFKLGKELKANINKVESVKAISERINSEGLIAFEDNTVGAVIFGIDPENEKQISSIHKKLNKGMYLSKDRSKDIVLGYKMLSKLKANVGDTIVILSQASDGSMANDLFRISGTVKLGFDAFDAMACFMNIETADELFAMYGKRTSLAISLNSISEIPEAKEEFEKFETSNLVFLDWEELMPDFKQAIDLDNISGVLMLVMLIIIVSFGILNTLLMSITERFKEFGVMLALGTKHSLLVKIVFVELLIILFLGLLVGALAAYGTNYWLMTNPIEITGEMAEITKEFGFVPQITSTTAPSIFINSLSTISIVTLVIFIYPALKIFKLEALKGIRYT